MRARPVPRNWVSGELAPWLDGIPGEVTNRGALTLENFVVKKQGAIQRRPGSFYVSEVKNTLSQTILIQCEIDSDNIYVLEMGNLYCRFYKNHTQVSLAAAAYEVTTPYSTGDLTDLRWCYVPDDKSLLITHPNHAIRALTYASSTSWAISVSETLACDKVIATDIYGHMYATDDLRSWEVSQTPAGRPHPNLIKSKNNYILATGTNLSSSGTSLLAIGTDLENWSNITPGIHATSINTSYRQMVSNEAGVVCLVPYGGSIALASYDSGSTWAVATLAQALDYHIIGYDKKKDTWRIGGVNGAYSRNNMLTWVSCPGYINAAYADISGINDEWLMVGATKILSANSITGWTLVYSLTNVQFNAIAHSTTSTPVWVVEATTSGMGSHSLYVSNDRVTWSLATTMATAGTNIPQSSLAWLGSKFIIFDFYNKTYQTSPDGRTWTTHSMSNVLQGTECMWTCFDDLEIYQWFNVEGNYPATCAFAGSRLIIGPTINKPATIWASRVGTINNFYMGEFADDGWSYDLKSNRNVDIQWMIGGSELVIGTKTAEGILVGSQDEGITPSSAHLEWISTFGSDNVQPARIGDTIVFMQRGGEIVRGLVPSAGQQAYKSPDLTAFADHIARGGITEIDHQDDPQTVAHFVRADGYGLGLTFEGTTRAWWRTKMGATAAGFGTIESLCVIPTSGAEDEIWAVVKWTVGASVRRFIVYFDAYNFGTKEAAHFVDCGYENAACASATVYASVLPQLAGESVDALINGSTVEKGLVVGAGGTLTIAATNALTLHAGLPYTSYAQTMRIDQNSGWGSGLGLSKRLGNLNVWVHQTIGGKFGPTSSITEAVAYTSTADLTTDCLSVNFPGQWDRDGYIWCIQDDPLPMTVVAVAPDMEMGDR